MSTKASRLQCHPSLRTHRGICHNVQKSPKAHGLPVPLGLADYVTVPAGCTVLVSPVLHLVELEICAPDLISNLVAMEMASRLQLPRAAQ